MTSLKIEISRHVKSRRQPENIFRWSRRDIIWTRASNTHAQLLQSTHSAFHEQTTSKDRKSTRKGKKQTSGQKKTKIYKTKLSTHDVYDVFVIFFNFSFLALPGDFWGRPERCIFKLKAVFTRQWNWHCGLQSFAGLRIPWAFAVSKTLDSGNLHREISRIPDSKDFPKSAIRFTLHWAIYGVLTSEKSTAYGSFFQGLLLRGLIGFLLVFKLFFSIRIK